MCSSIIKSMIILLLILFLLIPVCVCKFSFFLLIFMWLSRCYESQQHAVDARVSPQSIQLVFTFRYKRNAEKSFGISFVLIHTYSIAYNIKYSYLHGYYWQSFTHAHAHAHKRSAQAANHARERPIPKTILYKTENHYHCTKHIAEWLVICYGVGGKNKTNSVFSGQLNVVLF